MKITLEVSELENHALLLSHESAEDYLENLSKSICKALVYQHLGIKPDEILQEKDVQNFMAIPSIKQQRLTETQNQAAEKQRLHSIQLTVDQAPKAQQENLRQMLNNQSSPVTPENSQSALFQAEHLEQLRLAKKAEQHAKNLFELKAAMREALLDSELLAQIAAAQGKQISDAQK